MQDDNSDASKMWLEYIGKLNDRAINRQQASGFTNWAVLGVIAILIVKLIAGFPQITQSMQSGILYLTASAGVANPLLFGMILMSYLYELNSIQSSEVRLKPRLDRRRTPLVVVVLCVSLLVFGAANIAVAKFGTLVLHHWPFSVLGLIMILNAISYPISRLKTMLQHRKHYKDLPEISKINNNITRKQRPLFIAIMLLFITICVVISTVPVIQALPHITSGARVDAILWAFYATGVIILFIFVCIRMTSESYNLFLTSLERRIVIENLNIDKIRSEFVREYLGEDLREWLSRAEKHLIELHQDFESAANTAEKEFEEVSKLESNMKYEIEGRRKDICETFKKSLNSYKEYAEKLANQVEHLASQKAQEEAPELLKRILYDWRQQLKKILPRYNSVCEVCNKVPRADTQDKQCTPIFQEATQAGS